MKEDVNEAELCMRCIDPFLTSIIDDPDEGMFLRWTSETTVEARKSNGGIDSRPDLCVTKTCGVRWGADCGQGEAKPAIHAKDNDLICLDLVRVAVLSKEPLNNQRLEGVLGIHIIGRAIALEGQSQLVMNMPAILSVLDVFNCLCVPSKEPQKVHDWKIPSLPLSVLHQVFSVPKDRKRPRHLKHRHN
ncbi:hypothetical protein DM01DRAFT_353849 [Hesseltinella vesiculosa]|uniref:Uncharacterized protein n=1 Tax=Hesseltinella vesiculosa TaxID=101127 RepID=A0A1X2GA50_9FUNG|nr:hypothetical protein DM01DRAFT_353849 [Hesseltinella vesiculosa]